MIKQYPAGALVGALPMIRPTPAGVNLPVQYDLYNGTPPHERTSDTSRAAAVAIEPYVSRIQSLVLAQLMAEGWHGATDKELEATLQLQHETVSARRRELVQKRMVQDSGRRRATPSGRRAVVWVIQGIGGAK